MIGALLMSTTVLGAVMENQVRDGRQFQNQNAQPQYAEPRQNFG